MLDVEPGSKDDSGEPTFEVHSDNGRTAAVMMQASIDVPLREGEAIRPSPNRELTLNCVSEGKWILRCDLTLHRPVP